eukprot:TRINITY_DN9398_c0_g1_i1.p1 TRINITY_DN9398_c0_g1~~TRINITY_DN9398_c0_g1_i1.p1  ORF type:complete len:304 (+),score=48.42 TRINITY_DN9398_c0_g1_i1:34-945(+)
MSSSKYPVDLVLVRHGESEGNLVQEKSKKGDDSLWTDEFRARHTSKYRLTEKGRLQAIAAGEFIRNYISRQFDVYYTSEYTRAIETAGLLGFQHALWFVDFYLREQDNGIWSGLSAQEKGTFEEELEKRKRDWFYFSPPGGESIANAALRVERWLDELKASCNGLRVVAVCHGNIITAIRILIEKLKQEDFPKMRDDPAQYLHFGHIIHYTRRDPETGRISKQYDWVRSICPWDVDLSTNHWTKIIRPAWSYKDLLVSAEKVPRFFTNASNSLEEFKQFVTTTNCGANLPKHQSDAAEDAEYE